MSEKLRFLIPDGYSLESRQQFDSVGMTLAGELYGLLLQRRLPGAEYDVWFSSDPGATPPTDAELSGYAGVIWPGCNLTIYHNDDPRVQAFVERAAQIGRAAGKAVGTTATDAAQVERLTRAGVNVLLYGTDAWLIGTATVCV